MIGKTKSETGVYQEERVERKVVVTMSAADIDAALIEWAKKNLNFNPPEGASIQVEVNEEGCDDHGTAGEPAYATLTVKTLEATCGPR
jgi:hypothetical protein